MSTDTEKHRALLSALRDAQGKGAAPSSGP